MKFRPTHPGRTLNAEIIARNISLKDLSDMLPLSNEKLIAIMRGKRDITAKIAIKLSVFFMDNDARQEGVAVDPTEEINKDCLGAYWYKLQCDYDLAIARIKHAKKLEKRVAKAEKRFNRGYKYKKDGTTELASLPKLRKYRGFEITVRSYPALFPNGGKLYSVVLGDRCFENIHIEELVTSIDKYIKESKVELVVATSPDTLIANYKGFDLIHTDKLGFYGKEIEGARRTVHFYTKETDGSRRTVHFATIDELMVAVDDINNEDMIATAKRLQDIMHNELSDAVTLPPENTENAVYKGFIIYTVDTPTSYYAIEIKGQRSTASFLSEVAVKDAIDILVGEANG